MDTQIKEEEEKKGKDGANREDYSSFIHEILDENPRDLQFHFLGAIPLIEITKDFPLQSLGAIPLIVDMGDRGYPGKGVYPHPKLIASEAFTKVEASIMDLASNRSLKTILVTSLQPFEGKTTAACNIAISMIQSGKKVILVDANLRKPHLHEVFLNNENTVGLSTYLVEKKRLPSVTRRSGIDGLDVISSGPGVNNPDEILGSEKMKRLLKNLRKKYDYVIVDGTPIRGFSDSLSLAKLVDGVVLVISIGSNRPKNALQTAVEEVSNVKGKVFGVIVNRVQSQKDKNAYQGQDKKDVKKKENTYTEASFSRILEKDPSRTSTSFASKLIYIIIVCVFIFALVSYFKKSGPEDSDRNISATQEELSTKPSIQKVNPSIKDAPTAEPATETSQAAVPSDSDKEITSASEASGFRSSEGIPKEGLKEDKDVLTTVATPDVAVTKVEKKPTPSQQTHDDESLAVNQQDEPKALETSETEAKSKLKPEPEPTISDVYRLIKDIEIKLEE